MEADACSAPLLSRLVSPRNNRDKQLKRINNQTAAVYHSMGTACHDSTVSTHWLALGSDRNVRASIDIGLDERIGRNEQTADGYSALPQSSRKRIAISLLSENNQKRDLVKLIKRAETKVKGRGQGGRMDVCICQIHLVNCPTTWNLYKRRRCFSR